MAISSVAVKSAGMSFIWQSIKVKLGTCTQIIFIKSTIGRKEDFNLRRKERQKSGALV